MASDSITGRLPVATARPRVDRHATVDVVTPTDAEIAAASDRVEAVLDRLRRVDLQVVVVAPPDAERVAARDRARAVAAAAGRGPLFEEAAGAAREATLRAFARGGFSGTWAATEMSASIATAADRVAAAAAFEEAAMAAVVDDLLDDDALEVLHATSEELDRSTGLPPPGALSAITAPAGARTNGPLQVAVMVVFVLVCAALSAVLGLAVGVAALVIGIAATAVVRGRTDPGA